QGDALVEDGEAPRQVARRDETTYGEEHAVQQRAAAGSRQHQNRENEHARGPAAQEHARADVPSWAHVTTLRLPSRAKWPAGILARRPLRQPPRSCVVATDRWSGQ